ncbi:MAG: hypothetical protein NXI10_06325 [bacterium]|nr:hypothetical protein [bacterium]
MKISSQQLLVLIAIFCTSVCFGQSTKGNWTTEDKFTAIADLNAQRAVFESFLDSTQVDPLIQCIADELEQTFENPGEVDTASDTIQAISLKCLSAVGFDTTRTKEVSTSVKGNWSKQEKEAARETLEIIRGTMNGIIDSADVDLLFDCILDKMESKYTNFEEAQTKGENEISAITIDCISENGLMEEPEDSANEPFSTKPKGDPSSSAGSWSETDKELLENQLEELRPKFESSMGKEKTDVMFECIRFNFEHAFENFADIDNHPEIYKGILDECKQYATNSK